MSHTQASALMTTEVVTVKANMPVGRRVAGGCMGGYPFRCRFLLVVNGPANHF